MNILEALVELRDSFHTWTANHLATKVDKIEGKGLSTCDFTQEEKDKLASVAENATSVLVDHVLLEDSKNPVQNKVLYSAINSKSDVGHDHDDRYYTEAEVDALLAEKASKEHNVYQWRTIELLPFSPNTPHEFAYEDFIVEVDENGDYVADTDRYFDLPIPIEYDKYNYELKVECFGITKTKEVHDDWSLDKNGTVNSHRTFLHFELPNIIDISIPSTCELDGKQDFADPEYLAKETDGRFQLSEFTIYIKNGSCYVKDNRLIYGHTENNNILYYSSVDDEILDTAQTGTQVCLDFGLGDGDMEDNSKIQAHGIAFSYRAISERIKV